MNLPNYGERLQTGMVLAAGNSCAEPDAHAVLHVLREGGIADSIPGYGRLLLAHQPAVLLTIHS